MNWRGLIEYLVDRLDEYSSWIWILYAVTILFGVTLSPDQAHVIATIGSFVGIGAGILVKDKRGVIKRNKGDDVAQK